MTLLPKRPVAKSRQPIAGSELLSAMGYYDLQEFVEHDPRGIYWEGDVTLLWRYLASQAGTGLTIYYAGRLVMPENLATLLRRRRKFSINLHSLAAFSNLITRNPSRGRGLNDDQRSLFMDWVKSLA